MRGDLRIPVGDVADRLVGILRVAADPADRHVDCAEAAGADIGEGLFAQRGIRFGVVFARAAEAHR